MELWLDVPGFSNYEVSCRGRVRNKTTVKILKPNDVRGYQRVVLCDENGHHPKSVHRLVADAFYDGDDHDQLEVNHIDGDKSNNFIANLEWCTSSENRLHAFKTGLQKSPMCKKVMILETGEEFETMTACAKHIGGDMKLISACVRGLQNTHKGYHFKLID